MLHPGSMWVQNLGDLANASLVGGSVDATPSTPRNDHVVAGINHVTDDSVVFGADDGFEAVSGTMGLHISGVHSPKGEEIQHNDGRSGVEIEMDVLHDSSHGRVSMLHVGGTRVLEDHGNLPFAAPLRDEGDV